MKKQGLYTASPECINPRRKKSTNITEHTLLRGYGVLAAEWQSLKAIHTEREMEQGITDHNRIGTILLKQPSDITQTRRRKGQKNDNEQSLQEQRRG